jgi:HprK-related kinase A
LLIGNLPRDELARRLIGGRISLDTGAFTTRLQIELPHLVEEFAEMYAPYPVEDVPVIEDFNLRVATPSLLRRFVRPQAQTWIDGAELMTPLALDHAYPALESSLNMCVATSDLIPLAIHAAAIERDGRALIMPATSGSGKSTLCAALVCRGWRLLSDEMTLFCFEDGRLLPNPRPVSLKNRSIEIISAFEPRAHLSRIYRETNKGDVAYMRPPSESVERAHEKAVPGLVIAPAYREGATATLKPMSRTEGFRWLVDNSVNYSSMLRVAFDMLVAAVERCELYSLAYSNLDEAIDLIDRVHRQLPLQAHEN